MKPPICAFCHKRFSPSKQQGGLVRFSDYQALEKRVGHPKGLAWFCTEHFEMAKSLKHKPLPEALYEIKGSEN